MKHLPIRYILFLVLAVAGLTRCDEKETISTPPVAAFKLSPASGLTTDTFDFDASESKATNPADTLLFIRWDWDNDDIWDTGFSRSKKFSHRYYVPGSYTPRMEIRNESGLSDTIQSAVVVGRGYSAPQPSFTITPVSGNLRTEFIFDASLTRDDEDSLNTLKFRWDWEGDGIYDTEFTEQMIISHYYPASNLYNAVLQVADPQGLSATARKPVSVSTSNLNLVPQFTWSPEQPTTADTVLLDASSSYDPDNAGNTFTYRWNFTPDSDFDTDYLTNPVIGYQFMTEGENEIVLEIKDQWGLINQVKGKIWIGHANVKPVAAFIIGYEFGNLTTNFYFDAASSADPEDLIDQLKVRWDFENDGTWDTEFVKEKTATHKYNAAGTYTVKMQTMDTGGLTDATSLSVTVTDGTNETGLILDKKNNISYGTVKIGTQWWMAENLNEPASGKACYNNQSANCTTYGGLYTWSTAMNGASAEKAKGLCPTGWHIPTLTEWLQLIEFYGANSAKTHLEISGDSDFRMFLAGQRSTDGRTFQMLNQVANFWTSTKSSGENANAISFQKDQDPYFKLNLGQNYGFSVRCVKD
jgi:uncharacterized protein (TIGR02145 family)